MSLRAPALAFALTLIGFSLPGESFIPFPAALAGRWEGSLVVPRPGAEGDQRESFSLDLLPEGFAIVDFPDRSMFGFPAWGFQLTQSGFSFALGATQGGIKVEGRLSGDDPKLLEGSLSQGTVVGGWKLEKAEPARDYGVSFALARPGGMLRGSLLLPPGKGPFPLVLLVAGSGSTDRDGNNYQVPGRSDSQRLLAAGLAAKGVASLRYDRRGVGESVALAPDESSLRFDDEVEDLGALAKSLEGDPRYSSLTLVGHSDGALVAASLLAGENARGVSRLVVLASGGTSALETFVKAIDESPPNERAEGHAILDAILAGKPWPEPSPYYADSFRPSFQPYLSGWLNRDLKKLLPGIGQPVLLVEGDRDMQVELGDFLALAAARPGAAAILVPSMNHVLKTVPDEVDSNLASFSDPRFPLSSDLVDAIAAFASGQPLPSRLARVDGGDIPKE